MQGGSNMTGTVYTVVYTQIIPVIFEPPCIYIYIYIYIYICIYIHTWAVQKVSERSK